jgi:uncharacterized SAM-binding protein YcdF (DUF218 family)
LVLNVNRTTGTRSYRPGLIDVSATVMEHATRLWSYLSATRAHAPCDAIVVCCSYDLRVCDYACELLRTGVAPRLVLTGKTGNWTKHLWSVPEAHVFRDRALNNGVETSQIFIEDQSTNFGENIAFVRRHQPGLRRATFVTKPNSVLRVALTIPVHWPEIKAFVDAPAFEFPKDVSNVIGVLGVIHEMVGDVDRIMHYPARGFQIPHRLPQPILESWNKLVGDGFDRHLL